MVFMLYKFSLSIIRQFCYITPNNSPPLRYFDLDEVEIYVIDMDAFHRP